MEILNQKALLRPKSEACNGNNPFRGGTQIKEAFNEASVGIIAEKNKNKKRFPSESLKSMSRFFSHFVKRFLCSICGQVKTTITVPILTLHLGEQDNLPKSSL